MLVHLLLAKRTLLTVYQLISINCHAVCLEKTCGKFVFKFLLLLVQLWNLMKKGKRKRETNFLMQSSKLC